MIKNQSAFQFKYGLSLLRILATFSVIVIHVSGVLVVKFDEISFFNWNVANFFDSISRYSVPMFFMISGTLLLSKDYELKDFFKRRFSKILPPFLIWSLIYSLVNRYIFTQEVFNVNKIVKDIFYGSEYHLWFVYALLGVYLITPVLQKWIKNTSEKEVLYLLLIWLVTLIVKIPSLKIYFPKIDLTYFSGFIGYFVLGYYLSKYKHQNRLISILLIVFGFIITILGTYIFTLKYGKFYQYFYEYLSLNTLMVASGVFLIFNNIDSSSKAILTIINKLNQTCFGIYLIHPLMLKIFMLIGFDVYFTNPLTSILLVAIACFVFSFIVIYSLKKFKYGYLIA